MLFADDIALIEDSSEKVNGRHEEWSGIIVESKGLRNNRIKIEYTEYDFGRRAQEANRKR